MLLFLPQPEGPINTKILPLNIKNTLSTAHILPYRFAYF